jgi:hypothetical protein
VCQCLMSRPARAQCSKARCQKRPHLTMRPRTVKRRSSEKLSALCFQNCPAA